MRTRVTDGMARIAGGTFRLGSNVHYPEERPAHSVTVDGFWIDQHAVTNADFTAFATATGYVTFAERPLDPALYPGARPELLTPGSAVFRMPGRPMRPRDLRDWWEYVPKADWRHPEGPASTIAGRETEPVVLVRVKPELKGREPFKTVLSGNREAIAKLSLRDLFEILLATQSGMDVEAFRADVRKWLAEAKHPRWNRPYTELVYQPMLEVLSYLRANGYRTFIATGGSAGFVREYSECPSGRFASSLSWLACGRETLLNPLDSL